jgi:hypothetical protein
MLKKQANLAQGCLYPGGRIFSRVRPFYEQAVSDLEWSMHRSLWVQVTHSSFIEGSHTTKNTASGGCLIYNPRPKITRTV